MSADTLSELLRAVRLRGAIFFYVDGVSPWVAEAPPARDITAAILPGVEHMIEYHVVTKGRCFGALAGEAPIGVRGTSSCFRKATPTSSRARPACGPRNAISQTSFPRDLHNFPSC